MKLTSAIMTMLIVIAFGISGVSSGQKRSDPFDSVPLSQRDRLKSRLNDFIQYHRNKQWNNVYDLIGERYKNATE